MAISAVSAVSGLLSMAFGRMNATEPIPGSERVDARNEGASKGLSAQESSARGPALAGTAAGTAAGGAGTASGSAGGRASAPRPDPRGAAWLLGENQAAGPAAQRDQDRLAGLEGQKASDERKLAQSRNERSAETLRIIAQLEAADTQVRAHEAAHIGAGGSYITGGASYTYERGPDGREYAVGGEVGIDTSPVPGDPAATARKMETVRAAALAPSDPSSADLAIAAEAAAVEGEALAEIAASSQETAGKPTTGSINVIA